MSGIQYLSWDSQFFDRKIGKIETEGQEGGRIMDMVKQAENENYQLLYIYSKNLLDNAAFNGASFQHVDLKMTYSMEINGAVPVPQYPNIEILQRGNDGSVLYELAYQSGEYSRYRVDRRFGENDFKKMYRQWIDNCLTGEMADVVFVHTLNGVIDGFITLKKQGNNATIGLIATSREKRNQGIGKSLLNRARSYAEESGISTLFVTTQGGNINACRFYENNGFVLKSELNVYHGWL
nr:GNAT family N-acetyltransferase [uncultured Dyadobacter sp.]